MRMREHMLFYLPAFLLNLNTIHAQTVVTEQSVLEAAKKSNFDIRMANNAVQISSLNYGAAKNALYPTLNGSFNDEFQWLQLRQKTSSGENFNTNDVKSQTLGGDVTASALLFNGNHLVSIKNRLGEEMQQTQEQYNSQVQTTVVAVLSKYYEIVYETAYLRSLQEAVNLSNEQLNLANKKFAAGYANKSDVYQAQVVLNQKVQQVRQEQVIIGRSRIDLNTLLNWPSDSNYLVEDSVTISVISYEEVKQSLSKNPSFLSAMHGTQASEWAEKEINSQRFPSLQLNAGYNFNYNKSTAGFILYNQNYGPYAAVSLAVPIFNGGVYSKQYQASKISTETSLLQQEQISDQLEQSLENSWKAYQSGLQLVDIARQSVELSKKNLDIVQSQYALNSATIVDLRVAQEGYINSKFNVYDLLYQAKLAELQLKSLENAL